MRSQNGYIDDGIHIGQKQNCPNCSSPSYYQTVSREYCPSCNYEVDYWGSGANEIAEQATARNRVREEYYQEQLEKRIAREMGYEFD